MGFGVIPKCYPNNLNCQISSTVSISVLFHAHEIEVYSFGSVPVLTKLWQQTLLVFTTRNS